MAVTPHLSLPQAVKKSSSHSMGSCGSKGFHGCVDRDFIRTDSGGDSCKRRSQSKRGRGAGGGGVLLSCMTVVRGEGQTSEQDHVFLQVEEAA